MKVFCLSFKVAEILMIWKIYICVPYGVHVLNSCFNWKGQNSFIVTIQRFVENIWKNSVYADQNMCIVSWRIIYAHFDITHQAHFTTNSLIWISCHMCAYQEYNMIFGFFEAEKLCHTLMSVIPIYPEEVIDSWSFLLKFRNLQHS